MPQRLVAIHQPNFFPWLGYFDKIARSDVFCLMDNAQMPKKGGTWTNRVQLLVGGRATWFTVPIVRSYHGVRPIAEIEIRSESDWRTKLLKTLEAAYGRAPHFEAVQPLVESLLEYETASLAEFNEHVVRSIAAQLGLNRTRIVRGSTLRCTGRATDLLISMVRAVGGTAYLCGGGASGYQEDAKFAAAGIELIYQRFEHPVYPQPPHQEFTPGLSILDALMHCGIEGTAHLLEATRRRTITRKAV